MSLNDKGTSEIIVEVPELDLLGIVIDDLIKHGDSPTAIILALSIFTFVLTTSIKKLFE